MSDINAEIAEYLDSQGLLTYDPNGVTGDTFIDLMPSKPDNAIAVLTGVPRPGSVKHGYDQPAVQIIVRGKRDPRIAKQRTQDIYDELQGFSSGVFVTGVIWVVSCMAAQSGPIRLGVDDNNRHEFSLNFDLEVKNDTKYRK